MSLIPGKNGLRSSSSANMHPTAQISTPVPYSRAPNSSSGARYHLPRPRAHQYAPSTAPVQRQRQRQRTASPRHWSCGTQGCRTACPSQNRSASARHLRPAASCPASNPANRGRVTAWLHTPSPAWHGARTRCSTQRLWQNCTPRRIICSMALMSAARRCRVESLMTCSKSLSQNSNTRLIWPLCTTMSSSCAARRCGVSELRRKTGMRPLVLPRTPAPRWDVASHTALAEASPRAAPAPRSRSSWTPRA